MKDILQEFRKRWLEKPRIVLGIMTGTSFDGIDLAVASISKTNNTLLFKTLAHSIVEYPKELQKYFSQITSQNHTSVSDISSFNFLHPHCVAEAINSFIRSEEIPQIELIGYHGQTIWHQPTSISIGNYTMTSTFQLGSGSVLAQKTNIPVVSDFRSADMVFGGQGAPLVPIFDRDIFADTTNIVVLVNIGGIANISVLFPNSHKPIAYDVGPGNVWIDYITKKFYGLAFDEGGKIAKTGKFSDELWEQLLTIDFIEKPYPKSTGREEFSVQLLVSILDDITISSEDILHTLAKFTAYCIAKEILFHSNSECKVYVSGGGLHNDVIQSYIQSYLPKATFTTTETVGIASDAKEALCFAYLAWRSMAGLPISLPSITGAKKETISGSISFPF
ncbi:MAG: anhydro-N-acetylmuramic acid kinase [Candidatus Kapabacteria bacterium]|nr:anhydro-N-acetylmuramic acid kinase [Candidatus Kapabacteria bacterium]